MAVDAVHGRPGKLGALAWLLAHRSGEVEADLAQYYGIHDIHTLTVRRAWVLVSRLPRESRVIRAEVPDAAWSVTDHLAARLIDEVAGLTWLTSAIHSKSKPPRPKPVPRPGDEERERKRNPQGAAGLTAMIGGGVGVG